MLKIEDGVLVAEMETLLKRARLLIADNEARVQVKGAPLRVKGAYKDAYKWEIGDLIVQMQDLVKVAHESVLHSAVRVTPDTKAAASKIVKLYNEFLPDAKQHKHERGTMVDYAAVARLFSAGNRVRTELTFSHVRALSRVKAPEARAALTEQAIRLGWSVARLQAEINTAGRSPVEGTGTAEVTVIADGTAREWTKTQNSTWFCAQTKHPITNRAAMVELHIHPESTLDLALERQKKRGAAAKTKHNGAEPYRVLRFESASALLTWLGASLNPANLDAAVSAPIPGPLAKVASRIIVSPKLNKSHELNKSRAAKSATGGALASEALSVMTVGEDLAKEG